jgi:hypothetical protein
LFGFVKSLFTGFDSPNTQAWMPGREVGAVGGEVGSLDDGCAIAKFAEADLRGDDVFFEDL